MYISTLTEMYKDNIYIYINILILYISNIFNKIFNFAEKYNIQNIKND